MTSCFQWAVIALVVTSVTCFSRSQQSAGGELRASGCQMSTLRREFLVTTCSFLPSVRGVGSDDVTVGTRCSVARLENVMYIDLEHICVLQLYDGRSVFTSPVRGGRAVAGAETELPPPVTCPKDRPLSRRDESGHKWFNRISCDLSPDTTDVVKMRICCGGAPVDNEPPSITCYPPVNKSIVAEEGKCDAIVRWKDAKATDNVGVKR
ncbi:hypothetical protein NP493_541g02036 [Ridgeia piscesae]|uniref:Secreted protein n=1 Tax=Ridgeia piscesae TaxID=27915 RepID=A0AAD9KW72_RIDPI|nr:hypothetical protein NP493_541g02036 [Ridgeia piscesae]